MSEDPALTNRYNANDPVIRLDVCPICGAKFEVRVRKKYCSDACEVNGYRKAHRRMIITRAIHRLNDDLAERKYHLFECQCGECK